MSYFITDLHCDLLCYLEGSRERTVYDSIVRCSIPQLHAGNVKIQTLAVFAETGSNSVNRGMAQAEIFKNLPKSYPNDFIHFDRTSNLMPPPQIGILLAFEGASTFCSEEEPISDGLKRLQSVIDTIAKPLYISMTWNMENRFGGGTATQVGLKEDGKRLLNFLHEKQIAIDLSHASDQLAHAIFSYIDQENLVIPIIASHSNSRTITPVPRNLPDDIAKEILRRKGIIGLNFYSRFVGPNADENFVQHLDYWFKMGAEKQVCFGADFFFSGDLPQGYQSNPDTMFFSQYPDASCYGTLLALFEKQLGMNSDQLQQLANQNFLLFVNANS